MSTKNNTAAAAVAGFAFGAVVYFGSDVIRNILVKRGVMKASKAAKEKQDAAKSEASKTFSNLFDYIKEEVPFNPDWANGTGYFDGLSRNTKLLKLENGQRVKAVDEHGRRLIIVGTRLGNCVVFERYSDNANIIVCNLPHQVKVVFDLQGSLDTHQVSFIAGQTYNADYSINSRIECMSECFKAAEADVEVDA